VKAPPETCPNCGADVPAKAQACPECGADEKTGWSEEAYVGGLNLPDESFDYDEFVDREFGKKKARAQGVNWFWWVVAALLVIFFAAGLLRLR
jgi:predicted nucleic acid-binding Zn ribbon protein